MRDRSELLRHVTIVVLTHNRHAELARTLGQLEAVREGGAPDVVVVDNASTDDTARFVRANHPDVRLIRLDRNVGGAGRNAGAAAARTPYVAFCDDDTWWAAGSLETAVAALEQQPGVAVMCGRVLVGSDQRLDETCAQMARSPLGPADGGGGHPVLGFLAGTCVVRREPFLAAGGFDEHFFIGGEEELVALDLVASGWQLRYLPAVVVHHHPSPNRDPDRRGRAPPAAANPEHRDGARVSVAAARPKPVADRRHPPGRVAAVSPGRHITLIRLRHVRRVPSLRAERDRPAGRRRALGRLSRAGARRQPGGGAGARRPRRRPGGAAHARAAG